MKNILKLYFKYNKSVNTNIIKILRPLSEDELSKERNMYYKSINEQINHLILASWHYQNAINKISENKYFKSIISYPELLKKLKAPFEEYSEILIKLSDNLNSFIDVVTDSDLLIIRKNMKIYNGRIIDISIWQYLLQHITHQIHHQGQLSQLFDEMGIEHEYGNIFPLIPDSEKS